MVQLGEIIANVNAFQVAEGSSGFFGRLCWAERKSRTASADKCNDEEHRRTSSVNAPYPALLFVNCMMMIIIMMISVFSVNSITEYI